MKTIRRMIGWCCLTLLVAALVAGCTIVRRDETRIAEAEAKTAQANAMAREAQARTDALVGVAKEEAQTEIVREQEKTTRETAWLSTLPWLLLIGLLGGGLVGSVWLVLWYRGRAALVRAYAYPTGALMLPAPPQHRPLPQPRETRTSRMLPGPVADRARETGTQAVPGAAGCWLLVDVDQNVVEVMEPRRA